MSSLEDELHILRQTFVKGVSERVIVIDGLLTTLERAQEAEEKATALEDLLRQFHNLAGAGLTFGFPKISELGKRGELQCVELKAQQTLPDAAHLAGWRDWLEELKQQLQG